MCQGIHPTAHSLYFVRKFYKPDFPKVKHITYDLYTLPPSIIFLKPVYNSGIIFETNPCSDHQSF